MDELTAIVDECIRGDRRAFDRLVQRYQDSAVGYGYSLLGDFHLAQDAAQEAFLQAYRDLPALAEPAAFPGWLRKIVFKYCDRIRRRRRTPASRRRSRCCAISRRPWKPSCRLPPSAALR